MGGPNFDLGKPGAHRPFGSLAPSNSVPSLLRQLLGGRQQGFGLRQILQGGILSGAARWFAAATATWAGSLVQTLVLGSTATAYCNPARASQHGNHNRCRRRNRRPLADGARPTSTLDPPIPTPIGSCFGNWMSSGILPSARRAGVSSQDWGR